MFGAATAAYQVEGAWDVDGRGLSIWDTYTHNTPSEIKDRSNGDVAALSYYKYKEDHRLIRQMGMQFYRVSISWSRIMPTGLPNNISIKGVEHYHRVFDDMTNSGIIPVVTMYHWDLPQYIQNLGGWANPIIVKYFKEYARFLFKEYGDSVKYWLTINEPDLVALGYEGPSASAPRAPNVDAPGVGDYLAGHNMLLAHAAVYHLYDDEFRDEQKGNISIPIQAFWYEPRDPKSAEDKAAAERMKEQTLGWFSQPIFGKNGDYPQSMKDTIAQRSQEEGFPWSRLPEFTPQEIEYVKGTADYYSLNHYSTYLVTPKRDGWKKPSLLNDLGVNQTSPSWLPVSPALPWLTIAPQGLRRQLNYIKQVYGNWNILITENGYGDTGELNDENRMIYHGTYLTELMRAMCLDHVSVLGYTVWSLIDNFQWRVGYTAKFGLNYVNFTDPARPRIAKQSAALMKEIISTRNIPYKYIKKTNDLDLDVVPR